MFIVVSYISPRDISETHVLTGWDKVGLVRPAPALPAPNLHRRVVFRE